MERSVKSREVYVSAYNINAGYCDVLTHTIVLNALLQRSTSVHHRTAKPIVSGHAMAHRQQQELNKHPLATERQPAVDDEARSGDSGVHLGTGAATGANLAPRHKRP